MKRLRDVITDKAIDLIAWIDGDPRLSDWPGEISDFIAEDAKHVRLADGSGDPE